MLNFGNVKWMKEGAIDLLVESYSSSALVLQIRGLNDNEMIIGDVTTTADRLLSVATVAITAPPRMLTVRTASTGVKRGTCFVRISLRVEGVVMATLFSDYVTDTTAPAYPNGRISSSVEGPGLLRVITGTNPAAGSELSETVPTGACWLLHSLFCTFVTDATVTTRAPYLVYDDGASLFYRSQTVTGVTASLSSGVSFHSSTGVNGSGTLVTTGTIPSSLLLYQASRIRTVTVNIQAGDNYGTPVYYVEEWINP
jgi:hypothetical protein